MDLWTRWGKEMIGRIGKEEHWNTCVSTCTQKLVEGCCVTGSSAWCCDDLKGGVGDGMLEREGIYVSWRAIHIVRQKPTHYKAIILQLKKNVLKWIIQKHFLRVELLLIYIRIISCLSGSQSLVLEKASVDLLALAFFFNIDKLFSARKES